MVRSILLKKFREYDRCHQTRGNEICHFFGVSMIVLSVFGYLSKQLLTTAVIADVAYLPISAASVIWLITFGIYTWLDWKVGIPFSIFTLSFLAISTLLPYSVCFTLFCFGWIFQGIGHVIFENKSPAFFQNLTHLIIGPIWVFSRAVGYYRGNEDV